MFATSCVLRGMINIIARTVEIFPKNNTKVRLLYTIM
jgi:hypothetical protein